MQTHAYGYLGIGPPIGPPRGVCSISVFRRLLGSADVVIGPPRGVYSISDFRRMLSSEHFLGECSLRLDLLRSHAKRPGVNARKQCACSERFAGWLF